MSFYGKTYSKFKLVHGDFLEQEHRPEILQSTIVFVNNFAFGPEVDQHLKDIFADLNDGARIFSSKSFCALNFRITDRNLSGKFWLSMLRALFGISVHSIFQEALLWNRHFFSSSNLIRYLQV